MSGDHLTRDEILQGFPAGRAHTLLFLIECRTSYLASHSGVGLEPFLSDARAEERERAFLEAFKLGKEPPRKTCIQEIEHYIVRSATLLPPQPNTRATIAHLLSERYELSYEMVPNIRWVLGLDEPEVQEAYQRLYGQPVSSVYTERASRQERLRWIWSAFGNRLNALPPFWFVFVFTIALGVPQSILAMPIAVADVGPGIGIALTVAAGLVSFLTVGCVAEAAARSGIVRYGAAYIGRVAKDFLGVSGATVLSLATFLLFVITVAATFFAIARTLAGSLHAAAPFLTLVLFAVGLTLLVRGSVRFSVTLLVSIASVVTILLIAVMALSVDHIQLAFLTHRPRDPGGLSTGWQETIGVILMGYFGEAFVVQCAKAVLPRDPGGTALIRGSAAGLAAVTVLIVA
jgi:hypothetical protein